MPTPSSVTIKMTSPRSISPREALASAGNAIPLDVAERILALPEPSMDLVDDQVDESESYSDTVQTPDSDISSG